MAAKSVPISGDVLGWALTEDGVEPADLAARLKVEPSAVEAWVRGSSLPTRGQLTEIAKYLKRPSALFYRTEPPEIPSVPVALRTARGRDDRPLEAAERRQVRRARRAQQLLRWLRLKQGAPSVELVFLESGTSVSQAGVSLRGWIGVPVDERLGWGSAKDALERWREALEERGVLVFQIPLGRGGLRGFSLGDSVAPLLAANTAENLPARIFTLFHELAHLVSQTESACEPFGLTQSGTSIERWCEEVASAALMPRQELEAVANRVRGGSRPPQTDFDLVRRVAGRFHASLRATAVAMIRANILSHEAYAEVEEQAPVLDYQKHIIPSSRGGPKAPQARLSEFGAASSRAILRAVENDLLTERDARRYLRLDGAEVADLADALEGVA